MALARKPLSEVDFGILQRLQATQVKCGELGLAIYDMHGRAFPRPHLGHQECPMLNMKGQQVGFPRGIGADIFPVVAASDYKEGRQIALALR